MTGSLTSTAIILSDKEFGLLQDKQAEGLQRGIDMLAQMTFSKKAMGLAAVKTGASVAQTIGDNGEPTTVIGLIGDVAEAQMIRLLGKCWAKARVQVASNPWLLKACNLLQMGLDGVLSFVKGIVFSGGVLATVIPFYGPMKGFVDGAIGAVETHGHRKAHSGLKDMSDQVASGIPGSALEGFTRYVKLETIRSAAKTAYTFTKSLASLLFQVFTLGAASAIELAVNVAEAIITFVSNLVQAIMFDRTTEKFGEYARSKTLPSGEEFRTIIAGCPFVGCVFFAAANQIGHFQISSALSNPHRILSSNMLFNSVGKIGDAQKTACKYMMACGFTVSLRNKEAKAQYGAVLDMIEGYSNSSPRSDIITENASRWQKFKYSARKLRRRF